MKYPYFSVLLGFLVAGAMTACGGGGEGTAFPPAVAKTNADVAASPTSTAAVTNTTFTFNSGVPEFGTSAPTTFTFTSTAANPAFSISSGGKTASGTTAFGSCIFTITQSTFVAPSPLALGNKVTVHPCAIEINTAGQSASGGSETRTITLEFGTTLSGGVQATIAVMADGTITVNGKVVGTVTLSQVTGGT
jgi:hypothetical protein